MNIMVYTHALRAFRCKELTHFAGLLEKAAVLKAFPPKFTAVDYAEVNGHGYTLAQSKKGSWVASKKANRVALVKHWPAVAELLMQRREDELLKDVARALRNVGMTYADAWPQVQKLRDRREEERLWQVYLREGRKGILRETFPA